MRVSNKLKSLTLIPRRAFLNMREGMAQRFSQAGGRLRVRSALNPILWLNAVVTVPAITAMWRLGSATPIWLIIVALTPLGLSVIGFLYLLFFDRDKLQSEDYQIRKMELELIQYKGQDKPVLATDVERIPNPSFPENSVQETATQ